MYDSMYSMLQCLLHKQKISTLSHTLTGGSNLLKCMQSSVNHLVVLFLVRMKNARNNPRKFSYNFSKKFWLVSSNPLLQTSIYCRYPLSFANNFIDVSLCLVPFLLTGHYNTCFRTTVSTMTSMTHTVTETNYQDKLHWDWLTVTTH